MKVVFVLWTRPEIVKLAPVIHALRKNRNDASIIIHTNQHFSASMDSVFFKDLNLPLADYNLGINNMGHWAMTGKMLEAIEEILLKEKPDFVLVQWDTNSVLAWAVAAVKLGIRIWHVEAGLRSYDKTMPEEHNRVMTDHISNFLFVPTNIQKWILIREGISENTIYTTGNTVVDSTLYMHDHHLDKHDEILKKYNLQSKEYFFITLHRPSNVDDKWVLSNLLIALNKLAQSAWKKVFFPIHPRTRGAITRFWLDHLLNNFIITDPLPYSESLCLYSNAHVIATDSWGIQEEANILKVPTLILRDNTERPEVLDGGGAIIAWNQEVGIINAYSTLMKSKIVWKNTFGDGTAWEKIIKILSSAM